MRGEKIGINLLFTQYGILENLLSILYSGETGTRDGGQRECGLNSDILFVFKNVFVYH